MDSDRELNTEKQGNIKYVEVVSTISQWKIT